MSEYSINIAQLLAISGNTYNVPLSNAINRLLRTRSQEEYNVVLQEATELALGYQVQPASAMKDYGFQDKAFFSGIPIFQPTLLKSTDDQNRSEELFLDAAVVNLNRIKTVIVTPVQNRDSSVKEFINNGDWNIQISGIFWDKGWRYPLEKVQDFNRFMEKNTTLQVVNEIINGLGIYEVVVTGYNLAKTPNINCQAYSFDSLSEKPLPLIVEDLPDFDLPTA